MTLIFHTFEVAEHTDRGTDTDEVFPCNVCSKRGMHAPFPGTPLGSEGRD